MDWDFAGCHQRYHRPNGPLSDDGRNYCKRIATAGGRAHWINELGLVHGYLRARHSVPRAKQSFTFMISALNDMGHGIWPGDC